MATRRKERSVNITAVVMATIAGVTLCICAYFFFGRGSKAPDEQFREERVVADVFANCVSSSTQLAVVEKNAASGGFETTVKKLFAGKANALTSDEKSIARQVMSYENIAQVIQGCANKTPPPEGSGLFFASLRIHRPGGRSLSNAVVKRIDMLGSCTSNQDGLCLMPIVSTTETLTFVLDHESYRLAGKNSFAIEDIRFGAPVLETERKSKRFRIHVEMPNARWLVKIRIEAQLVSAGEYYAVDCTPIESDKCKTAELGRDGSVEFEHEADFKSLSIIGERDGHLTALATYTESIPASLDLVWPSDKPSSNSASAAKERAAVPCGTRDALRGAVARFPRWERPGTYTISANVDPDGRLFDLSLAPENAELLNYLRSKQVFPPPDCVTSRVSLTYEAATN